MESLKKYESLSFEHLIIGAFMKEHGNCNDAEGQNDESMNMNSTTYPEATELLSLVSELAPAAKYKRIAMGIQAEKECDGVISPGGSVSSRGSRRNGGRGLYSDEEDNGGFMIQRRKHLRDDVNFLELKKYRDQVASVNEKINLTQEGLQRLLLEMPMIENIIQDGNCETLPSDDVEANAMTVRMHRAYKIHAENVTKANLLLRIISLSKDKYDLRSSTSKKLRGIIDGILEGTYDTSPNKYDL